MTNGVLFVHIVLESAFALALANSAPQKAESPANAAPAASEGPENQYISWENFKYDNNISQYYLE